MIECRNEVFSTSGSCSQGPESETAVLNSWFQLLVL